jgi:hypothetical protein
MAILTARSDPYQHLHTICPLMRSSSKWMKSSNKFWGIEVYHRVQRKVRDQAIGPNAWHDPAWHDCDTLTWLYWKVLCPNLEAME